MNKFKKKLNENKYLGFLILFAALLLINICFGFRADTDDNWFKEIHTDYPNVFNFLTWRYNVYSARVIPDGIDYFIFSVPIIVWQFINTVFIFIGSYLISKIVNDTVTIRMMVLSVISLLLVNFALIWDSIYWVTGSLNYLWPAVAALFILKPYIKIYQGKNEKLTWYYKLSMIISAIFVGLSNEQILALLLGFILLFEGYNMFKNKKINLISIPIVIILIIIIIFLFISPGISARQAHEIDFWTPLFKKYSLNLKIRIWYIWAIRNIAKIYYFTPVVVTSLMYLVIKKTKIMNLFFITQVFLVPLTMLSSYYIDLNRVFTYLYQPISVALINHDFWFVLIPYFLWTIELIVLISGIILASKNKIMTSFFMLSIFAGLAIVGNSPAIFSTVKLYRGDRIFFFIDFYVAIYITSLLSKLKNYKTELLFASIALGNVLLGIAMF